MKYLARLSLLLLVPLACGISCLAQDSKQSIEPSTSSTAEHNLDSWKEFLSPEGHFTVSFPGIPQEQYQPLNLQSSQIDMHRYRFSTSNVIYVITYVDYSYPLENPDTVKTYLDSTRNGGVALTKGKLLSETDIDIGGHPGRLLKIDLPNGNVLRGKFFVVDSRLYSLAVTTPKEIGSPSKTVRDYDSIAAKFLDSFRLTASDEEALGEVDRLMKKWEGKMPVYGVGPANSQPKSGAGSKIVSGGAFEGKTINKPQPAYPAIAKAAHVTGTVVVLAIVNEEGKVIAAQAQSGPPLLRAAAVKAAHEVQFTPTLLDGKPVKIMGTIQYNFTLR